MSFPDLTDKPLDVTQSARRAVREFCLACVGGSPSLVTNCTGTTCALWRFRFGVKPETAERRRPEDMDASTVLARHRGGA